MTISFVVAELTNPKTTLRLALAGSKTVLFRESYTWALVGSFEALFVFESFLTYFQATGVVAAIGLSLKPNHKSKLSLSESLICTVCSTF